MKNENTLINNIVKLYRNSHLFIVPRLEKYEIGKGQWYFLNKLFFDKEGYSQEELSKELVVDKAHTARAMKYLEEKNYVYSKKDENDGRKKNIYLTDKSKNIKDDYCQIYRDLNDMLLDGFSKEERKKLEEYLERMEKNIDKYINRKE